MQIFDETFESEYTVLYQILLKKKQNFTDSSPKNLILKANSIKT